MRLKAGAKIKGLQPEILLGLMIVYEVMEKYQAEMIVTEVTGGTHMTKSKHYVGQAVDLRSKHLSTEQKRRILEEGKTALGSDFDFILEGEGEEQEHFHAEFDPK
jgi:hypothetical protein